MTKRIVRASLTEMWEENNRKRKHRCMYCESEKYPKGVFIEPEGIILMLAQQLNEV